MIELTVTGQIESFDEDKREVDVFILPWDTDAETARGLERFDRASFDGIEPGRIVFRQRHQDPPTGRGVALEAKDDGLHGTFKISRTAAGDEQLTLIRDGVEAGVSVGFEDGQKRIETLTDGRKRYTHQKVNPDGQLEVSTTWKPAFKSAQVLQIRSEETSMTDEQPIEEVAPVAAVADDSELRAFEARTTERFEALQDRIAALGLHTPDSLKQETNSFHQKIALGADLQRENALQAFAALDDVISSDNLGVIPEMRSSTIIGIIDSSRPFLSSTTRETTPPAGETWKFPKITQRPEVGLQATEKADVESRKTTITTVDFPMVTYAGAGDLSIQLMKRSSPDFLNLWMSLLGEQYAIVTDNAAVDDLLSETAVVEGTGTFDPESPSFGEAFENGAAAAGSRPGLLPNRIWLSTAALVAFIDAKSPSGGGGVPLYPGMAGIGGLTGGGGSGPEGFNMTPVWVPALDDESVDVIIGPSSGFHWVEDGTYTLTADVPLKAGRDVGLVGMIWFAPIYPAAFTTYALAS